MGVEEGQVTDTIFGDGRASVVILPLTAGTYPRRSPRLRAADYLITSLRPRPPPCCQGSPAVCPVAQCYAPHLCRRRSSRRGGIMSSPPVLTERASSTSRLPIRMTAISAHELVCTLRIVRTTSFQWTTAFSRRYARLQAGPSHAGRRRHRQDTACLSRYAGE